MWLGKGHPERSRTSGEDVRPGRSSLWVPLRSTNHLCRHRFAELDLFLFTDAHRAALLSNHPNEFANSDVDASAASRPFDDLAYLSSLPEYRPSRKGTQCAMLSNIAFISVVVGNYCLCLFMTVGRKRKRRGTDNPSTEPLAEPIEGDKMDQSEVDSDTQTKGKGKARAPPTKKRKTAS